jgi:thiamine kinase-like enzyme
MSDLRPKALPALFKALLADSDLGFKSADLVNLRNSQAMLIKMCLELDAIGIPTTLEHGDFTDDNILIKNHAITFLDFGDATLSHPFFSLAAFLNHAESHHGLEPSSRQYVLLRDAYLQEWRGYASHEKLVHGFAIAYPLMAFVWAFGLKRIQSCPGIDASEYASYVDKVMNHFYATFPRP